MYCLDVKLLLENSLLTIHPDHLSHLKIIGLPVISSENTNQSPPSLLFCADVDWHFCSRVFPWYYFFRQDQPLGSVHCINQTLTLLMFIFCFQINARTDGWQKLATNCVESTLNVWPTLLITILNTFKQSVKIILSMKNQKNEQFNNKSSLIYIGIVAVWGWWI